MRVSRRILGIIASLLFICSNSHAADVGGQAYGEFVSYSPNTATVSGLGTDHFTWGNSGLFGGRPSSFAFNGKSQIITNMNGRMFSLGTLSYENTETQLGTEASAVILKVRFNINLPAEASEEFELNLAITTTPNSGTMDSSDVIELPAMLSVIPMVINGEGYTLTVFGFGEIIDHEAMSSIFRFHINEGQSIAADLIASISGGHGSSSDIIAMGDSVAAGYGLGPEDGNSLSYAMQVQSLWSGKRGYKTDNIAISGSVSGDCEEICYFKCQDDFFDGEGCRERCLNGSTNPYVKKCQSVVEHQLEDAVAASPRFVTLTVGANDINFSGCITSWLSNDLINNPTANECWITSPLLESRLDILWHNLITIFETFESTGTEVYVTNYYDPFPKRGSRLCKQFYMPIAAAQMYYVNHRIGTLKEVKQLATQLQDSTSSFASAVILELNATIASAASYFPNVHLVNLNFERHDFCRSKSSAWVYGTSVSAWYTYLKSGFIPKTVTHNSAMPSVCPYSDSLESRSEINIGNSFFGLNYSTNCMPHPTLKGQTAIAKAVIKSMKSNGVQ